MTIITGSQFRANQGKYIGMAYSGERVILSSKYGYAELKPVDTKDKDIKNHHLSKGLTAIAKKVRQEYKEGKVISCNTPEEIEAHINSL